MQTCRATSCVLRTVKMEERIIECVRNKELLYNFKLRDYKNASKKQEAWEQIATEFNITATQCKTKWNLLRNAFIHAMARRKTGQGVKNFKKWKFEEEMAFLLPFMANRNTIATPVGEFSHESTESSGADIIIVEESLNTNNTQQKKRHLDNYHEDMLNPMKARSQRRSDKNDIDLFFNSIAETVKKSPKLEQLFVNSAYTTPPAIPDQTAPRNDEAVTYLKKGTTERRDMDEYDLYGQLLAKKLRKLNEHQRDVAMHEIDNIMFRAKMQTGPSQSRSYSSSPSPVSRKMKSPVFIVTQQNYAQCEDENIPYQDNMTGQPPP